jgi:hypothetical protein
MDTVVSTPGLLPPQQVAMLTVFVAYRKPGNVIEHLPVRFNVFRYGSRYTAVPLCNEAQKRLTALPNELLFTVLNGNVVCRHAGFTTLSQEIAARCNQATA